MASSALAVIEDELAKTIAPIASFKVEPEEEKKKFDFDKHFQKKIAALLIRDNTFAIRTQGLIFPEHFENSSVATVVNLAQEYWEKYKQIPSAVSMVQMIRDARTSGRIRSDLAPEVSKVTKELYAQELSDRDSVGDMVGDFARSQAMYIAMNKAIALLDKGKIDEVKSLIDKASLVGIQRLDLSYDYFAEIENRSAARKDRVAGVAPPRGITTGLRKIDALLFNKGWGRGELSILMGGAKAGKSTGLLFFAKNAALAGHNTLYVTLEMSSEIASSRIDACISETEMKELESNIGHVEEAVKKANVVGAGKLFMAQMPGYSLTPSELRRMVLNYNSSGTKLDLVVVDYLDLMAPDHRSSEAIENSKDIFVNVRAIGQEENIAILSAIQTNREGFKSVTAKAEHAAEDFNKIRIADITISINVTEDERTRGEARLYFAAARNDAGGVMVQIKQDIERMIFIKGVIGIM